MSDELVERLRDSSKWAGGQVPKEILLAADHIETLEARILAEREACAKIALFVGKYCFAPMTRTRDEAFSAACEEVARRIRARAALGDEVDT